MTAEIAPDTIYITYINTTPEKVWEALTNSAFTTQYFFGMQVESDWRPGSPWALRKPDGQRTVHGTVVEADPSRRLKVIWAVDGLAEPLPDCEVTYDIEPMGDVVKLTMTEHHPAPLDHKWLEGGKQGWPKILSGLKTLLETGSPLPVPVPQPPG